MQTAKRQYSTANRAAAGHKEPNHGILHLYTRVVKTDIAAATPPNSWPPSQTTRSAPVPPPPSRQRQIKTDIAAAELLAAEPNHAQRAPVPPTKQQKK